MTVRGFRIRVFLWILAALLACLGAAHAASGGPEVWISPDGELTADAITLNRNGGKGYTLYLPGNLKTEDLKFGLADGVSFTFGSLPFGEERRRGRDHQAWKIPDQNRKDQGQPAGDAGIGKPAGGVCDHGERQPEKNRSEKGQ